jgi:putative membrane protein
MSPIAQAAALVAAAIHVSFFAVESVTFTRPETYHRFFVASQGDAEIVRPWAFNQGFYNLFLAVGAVAGVVAVNAGQVEAGRALVLFACGSMAAAGIVLLATDRRFLRPALIQAVPPLIALGAWFL